MDRKALQYRALSVSKTLFSLLILAGFLIGTLPVLLPLILYRCLSRSCAMESIC
jgi:hypothetical protein